MRMRSPPVSTGWLVMVSSAKTAGYITANKLPTFNCVGMLVPTRPRTHSRMHIAGAQLSGCWNLAPGKLEFELYSHLTDFQIQAVIVSPRARRTVV